MLWADQDFQRYQETVGLLSDHGFSSYRMSVSWTRVLSYVNNLYERKRLNLPCVCILYLL